MQKLYPNLELLAEEYVLVQAWKKTSSYIRYHNWFADTLSIDRATADLPNFIQGISSKVRNRRWQPKPLRLVPAPKSHPWTIDKFEHWIPEGSPPRAKIRPLAHVSLEDQVLATAIMLCLADRVETMQGDPKTSVTEMDDRMKVTSYGNRLFSDREADGSLVHRWGSSKLYRAYYQDYQQFLTRPELIAEQIPNQRVFIIQSDLKQFYDRVRPELLREKLSAIMPNDDEKAFLDFSSQVFDWRWDDTDLSSALAYARDASIQDFDRIALPQGLVSAGFFANVVLLDFDRATRTAIGREIAPGLRLHDVCRYVDDLRVTIAASPDSTTPDAGLRVAEWLDHQLHRDASGLQTSPDKTKVAVFHGEEQPLIRQARKMQRIQSAISGGFDAAAGEEIIQAVQGLVRSQAELAIAAGAPSVKSFTAIPDVRDETLGRFAAARFRTTFRSLRPLLDNSSLFDVTANPQIKIGEETFRRARTTQEELDDEARSFAIGLVHAWIRNPSNVRLLRVAVDLWPTPQILQEIMKLFEPYLSGAKRGVARSVAFYCLAELLRAGATETGIVPDKEALPAGVDVEGYRSVMGEVAMRIVEARAKNLPWFLRQQALLFIAVWSPIRRLGGTEFASPLLVPYYRMLKFLNGENVQLSENDYAINAVVARRSFLSVSAAADLIRISLNPERFTAIASRDLEFARELWQIAPPNVLQNGPLANDLGAVEWTNAEGMNFLRDIVRNGGDLNSLRNEIGVLSFAVSFLEHVISTALPSVITPSSLQIRHRMERGYMHVTHVAIQSVEVGPAYRSIYTPPNWVPVEHRWRFQLGFLIRYILTGKVDFSAVVKTGSWRDHQPIYRPTRSHWLQRLYGFYNGHEAFGDDWLPVSQFTQDVLYSLLSWPGCRDEPALANLDAPTKFLVLLQARLDEAKREIGEATGVLMLKVPAPIPGTLREGRPLRACVVQSVTPEVEEIESDLTVSSPGIRRKHRNHLSTALAAVEKMLALRDTHKDQRKRLDWLIFPELSVHPNDIRSHLLPFARAFRTIILAGMTYEELFSGRPLVNSALWIIPRMVAGQGLQVVVRRQGKQHLAPMEMRLNEPNERVRGFRPCQWLLGYQWSLSQEADPLWLSAAICYDATDLKLAADLRDRSDVFAIPALNQDVGTFDQMAQALHYHMYQLVLVANNGSFGGSNAHLPKGGPHQRQVFHTHGQPQATISFFEIDDIQDMKARRSIGKLIQDPDNKWKYPPAGC